METRTKVYIGAVVIIGLCLLLAGFVQGGRNVDAAHLSAYLALACIASTWKVGLPGMQGTISVNFLFVLIGVAELSLPETLILGIAATLTQSIWHARKKLKPVQLAFNLSAISISIYVTHSAVHAVTAQASEPAFLALSAALYFFLNTALVSVVLSLVNKTQFLSVWRTCHLWTFPFYLTGAAIAGVICNASRTLGWRQALLPLLLMYLVFSYYRLYIRKQKEQPLQRA